MSIASRIDAIEEHLTQDYVMLEKLGFYNNENKNIQNISPILENFYNKVGNKTKIVKDGIVGETSQETTTGKNIFSPSNVSGSKNGITYSYDANTQTYTINGTCDTDNTLISAIATKTINFTSGITTLSVHLVSGSASGSCYLDCYSSNYSGVEVILANLSSQTPIISSTASTTYTSSLFNNRIKANSGAVFNNLKIKIMVANSTDTTYEEYTGGIPAPNPDFPMSVNTRTGELSYKVQGKNLFDNGKPNVYFNASREFSDTTGASTTNYIEANEGDTFTISVASTSSGIVIASFDETYTCLDRQVINTTSAGRKYLTYTCPANTKYIIGSNYDYTNNNTQLEQGNEGTSYEPYISRTFPINLGNIELCKIGTYQDYIKKSTGKNIFDKDNANILNNVYIAANILETNGCKCLYIPCQPNTTYTVSKVLSARFTVASTTYVPALNVACHNRVENRNATSITITTSSNDNYLVVFYYYSTYDTLTEQEILNSIQIEEGSQASPYEPFGYKWYKHSDINKIILNGSESGWKRTAANNKFNDYLPIENALGNNSLGFSNYFTHTFVANETYGYFKFGSANNWVIFLNTSSVHSTLDNFKTWLSTHNTDVYYVLATSTTTEITDTELISQLDAIEDFLTQYKINDEFILGYDEPSVEY